MRVCFRGFLRNKLYLSANFLKRYVHVCRTLPQDIIDFQQAIRIQCCENRPRLDMYKIILRRQPGEEIGQGNHEPAYIIWLSLSGLSSQLEN